MLLQAAAGRSWCASAIWVSAQDAVAPQHAPGCPAPEVPRQALPAHPAWAASTGQAQQIGLPADLLHNPTLKQIHLSMTHRRHQMPWLRLNSVGAPAGDVQEGAGRGMTAQIASEPCSALALKLSGGCRPPSKGSRLILQLCCRTS